MARQGDGAGVGNFVTVGHARADGDGDGGGRKGIVNHVDRVFNRGNSAAGSEVPIYEELSFC